MGPLLPNIDDDDDDDDDESVSGPPHAKGRLGIE